MVTETKRRERAGAINGETPRQAWLWGLLAWLVPGAGHLGQGRWRRGLLLGGAVWTMYALGQYWGGRFFPLGGTADGTYLDIFWSLMNLGLGAIYGVSWLAGWGLSGQAQWLTSEYGDMFLKVAGLLNYLVMLDAFDIGAGRKG